ncbi:MAG: L-lysine 6-transaminase, partial [Salinibacter sp.]
MEAVSPNSVRPQEVRELLSEHILTKGMMPLVLDMEESQGVRLRDEKTGRTFIDLFGFYASSPLGMNHPKMAEDEAFTERLVDVALNKVTNSDVMTEHMARFVDTFDRVGIPE